MKKLILTVGLALVLGLGVSLKADDNAALQMKLAQQTAFQQRVAYLLMREAFVVLAESSGTANHVNRMAFAVSVRNNVNGVIQNGYVTALVGRPNLVAETTTCTVDPQTGETCTTSATDAEIASQIATDWNLWSNNQ